MEDSKYQMNPRQLKRMIILETGTAGCLFVTLWSGQEHGLLMVMLSIIGSLFYGGILMAIGRTDGGFYAMTERSLPGFFWRLIWFIYVVRFAIRGAWMLSYLEYLIHETLYSGSRWMILIPLLFVCVYAGTRNLEGRARLVELLFWWVVIPLAAIFLIGLWKADFSVLVSGQDIDVRQLFTGEYKLMALFLPLELLVFRMSALKGRDHEVWTHGMKGVLLSGLWLLLVYVVTVGILGISWSHRNLLGVTDAMEQITIRGGGLERLDILILLFWLIGGIIALSAYFFQGQQLLRRVFSMKAVNGKFGGSLWAALFQALLTFAIYFCFDSPNAWSAWYLKFACYIDFPVSIGVPVLIWCIYKIKRKKELAVWNKNIKMEEEPVKTFKGKQFICFLIGITACSLLVGCNKQDSIEDRAYVENLHVTPTGVEYKFRCELAYISQDSLEPLDMKAGQATNANIVQNGSTENKDNADLSGAVLEGENDSYEYIAAADSIEDFDKEFHRLTGCQFDYSHLKGIYLEHSLYDPAVADDILEEIWEETQAVLTTPIYEEGVAIGDQKEETLGDWLKETK